MIGYENFENRILSNAQVRALQQLGWSEQQIATCCVPRLEQTLGEKAEAFRKLAKENKRAFADKEKSINEAENKEALRQIIKGCHYCLSSSSPFIDILVSLGAIEPPCELIADNHTIQSLTSNSWMYLHTVLPDKGAWVRSVYFNSLDIWEEAVRIAEADAPALCHDVESAKGYLAWFIDKVDRQGYYHVPGNWLIEVEGIIHWLKKLGVEDPIVDDAEIIIEYTDEIKIDNEISTDIKDTIKDNCGAVYSSDGKMLIRVPDDIRSFTIAPGTEIIAGESFSDCDKLESIIIPDSVRFIGRFAFSEIDKLKELVIPDGVMIMNSIVEGCTALERLVLPSGTSCLDHVAIDCPRLKEVVLPKNCRNIYHSFSGSDDLEIIHNTENLRFVNLSFDMSTKVNMHPDIKNATVYDVKDVIDESDAEEIELYKKMEAICDIMYSAVREDGDEVQMNPNKKNASSFERPEIDHEIVLDFGFETIKGYVHESSIEMTSPYAFTATDVSAFMYDMKEIKINFIEMYLVIRYILEHEDKIRADFAAFVEQKKSLEAKMDDFLGARPRVCKEYRSIKDPLEKISYTIVNPYVFLSKMLGLEEPKLLM